MSRWSRFVIISLLHPYPTYTTPQILPTKYDCNFSPTKTYLLSGCLGGIGRSITKWMMKRGAKKFAMIGRSGLDKEPARRLVKDLEDAGGEVNVTRGDVGDAKVVEEAVAGIDGDIGGVVQAAMGLDVCAFPSSISFALSPQPQRLPFPLSLPTSVCVSYIPFLSYPYQHHAHPNSTNRKRSGPPCPTNPGTPL